MARRKQQLSKPTVFGAALKENGWLLKTRPDPMLLALGFDEFIYVEAVDRLVHLHISAKNVEWEARRYTRETFGDYTTSYKPLSQGRGLESLKQFVEGRRQ